MLPKKNSLLIYLFALTGIFLLFEISFFIQWAHFYLGDFNFIAHHLAIPHRIIPSLATFGVIVLSIHILYTFIIWAAARLLGIALALSWRIVEKIGFALWIIGIIAILFANQAFFPNSKFSLVVSLLIPAKLGFILLMGLFIFWMVVTGWVLLGLFYRSRIIFLILLPAVGFIFIYQHSSLRMTMDPLQQPNIIMIGIDSLRPDFLNFYGAKNKTPALDHFLKQAVVFDHAVTPLARTFPAWVSMLTGEYPKHHGIRTNLQDQTTLDLTHTLPKLLHDQGYKTIFATDEVRFSNIDATFGFDQTITPPIGLNDFLLGTLNDFPMTNLLINTAIGQWLFPFSYSNRGVFTAYDPDAFIHLLQRKLSVQTHQPIFLAIHFCLPHYPYFWGREKADDQSLQNYRLAVQRADQQFNDFMALLKAKGLLRQSVVILLSDHGEAIELPNDRLTRADLFVPGQNPQLPHFYPMSFETEKLDASAGHGTDVLGWPQYHVLLALRFYPGGEYPRHRNKALVSLLDIKPTILSFLHIRDEKIDGHSLLRYLSGQFKQENQQDFFIESDFSPAAIRAVHPNMQNVLFEGIDYFQIDPQTTRILVKKDMLQLIMSSKQYADLYQDWILALYPNAQNTMTPILVNQATGQWTNDLTTSFAEASPATQMLMRLKNFYHDELADKV